MTEIAVDSTWRSHNGRRVTVNKVTTIVTYYPEGGGFQHSCPQEDFERMFSPAPPTEMLPWRRSVVYIDNSPVYPCYLRDKRWNGWQCPMFARHVADYMLGQFATGKSRWDGDTFILDTQCGYPNNEDEWRIEKETIVVDGVSIDVWGIGSGCYTWEEVTLTTFEELSLRYGE